MPTRRGRPHRSWPERLVIAGTFLSALVCLLVAGALVVAYSVVRNRNVAEFENPAIAAVETAPPLPAASPPPTTSPRTTTTMPATTTSAARTTSTAAPGVIATDAAGTVSDGGLSAGPVPDGSLSAGPVSDSSPTTTGARATTPPATGNAEQDGTAPATEPAAATTAPEPPDEAPATTSEGSAVDDSNDPATTFPEADPDARNFLITGADNNACIDPDSPFAGAFGDRATMGERSDTIMIIRVDPSVDRAAVLSFPRDLWVEIADTGSMQRINAAYRRDEPQRLADTIYRNFGVPIDHFIQVDFCAFKELVDAVGGVSVPFEHPTRDTHTGLLVEEPGCVRLDGEMALAYVRSRYYEYEDPAGSGRWRGDPTSDLGRVSRQQDFLRRILSSVLEKGPLDTRLVSGLIEVADHYIVTDRRLTPARMLEFAGVLNDVDPDEITTYQIESIPRNIDGNSVLIPRVEGDNMRSVLALFQGELSLADAPVQQFEETTTVPPRPTWIPSPDTTPATTGTGSAAAEPAAGVTTEPAAPSTEPAATTPTSVAGPAENQVGIVPPRDVDC